MGFIRIKKVIYDGDFYNFESPDLDKDLVLIEGDNGTGKSTLFNLIYYGLGGRVEEFLSSSDEKHQQITNDKNNFVELYLNISGGLFVLRRYLQDNDIIKSVFSEVCLDDGSVGFLISKLAEDTEVLPVYRGENRPDIFSDWLLEKLEISVVEIYQGYTNYKINSSDLFRLIYHDQQPDPRNIYKRPDVRGNFVSDSETQRKAIFELLIGKSFSEFYDAIVESKKADKEKNISKGILAEYTALANSIRGENDLKNLAFLLDDLRKREEQLDKLHSSRTAFKNNRSGGIGDDELTRLKADIIFSEIRVSEDGDHLISLYNERSKLSILKEDTFKEVSQIQKVIFTHDQLNLFSADTCPYCLNKVDRLKDHCVCGSSIVEEQYERFFYTSKEYKNILKSKTKTLATIKMAYDGCTSEISDLKNSISKNKEFVVSLKNKLKEKLGNIDSSVDIESLNDIDDMILEVREDIGKLSQLIEIEAKLEKFIKDYDYKRGVAQDADLVKKELEIKTKREISSKVSAFSSVYNQLMVETLEDCRSARISIDDYLPVINEGEYREASSRVSVRLMYYLTLLKMSIDHTDVAFPKFLLVDTPETAGIELEYLVSCLSKFENLSDKKNDYQVILATGLGKYPQSMKDNRCVFMPNKKNRLLVKKI